MSGVFGPVDYGPTVQGQRGLSATATNAATASVLQFEVNVFETVGLNAVVLLPSVTNCGIVVMNRGANALNVTTQTDQIETYGSVVAVAPGGDSTFWMFDPPMKPAPRTWWLS